MITQILDREFKSLAFFFREIYLTSGFPIRTICEVYSKSIIGIQKAPGYSSDCRFIVFIDGSAYLIGFGKQWIFDRCPFLIRFDCEDDTNVNHL